MTDRLLCRRGAGGAGAHGGRRAGGALLAAVGGAGPRGAGRGSAPARHAGRHRGRRRRRQLVLCQARPRGGAAPGWHVARDVRRARAHGCEVGSAYINMPGTPAHVHRHTPHTSMELRPCYMAETLLKLPCCYVSLFLGARDSLRTGLQILLQIRPYLLIRVSAQSDASRDTLTMACPGQGSMSCNSSAHFQCAVAPRRPGRPTKHPELAACGGRQVLAAARAGARGGVDVRHPHRAAAAARCHCAPARRPFLLAGARAPAAVRCCSAG